MTFLQKIFQNRIGCRSLRDNHCLFCCRNAYWQRGTFSFGGRFKKGHILLTGMVWDGITFIPLYFVKSLSAATILVTIHAVAIPLLVVPRTSLIQDIVPANMTGRIFALMHLAVVGMSAISAGLSGLILELINAPTLFLLIGIGGGLCGLAGWIFAKDLRRSD